MKERGQSLVELAISLTMLLFLLSGAVEFGLAFFQLVQLKDAAQEGALYGSMEPHGPDLIEQRVRASSTSPIDLNDPAQVTVIVTGKDAAGNNKDITAVCEGDGVQVQVVYNHHIFMPFLPQLIGTHDIPLRGVVVDTVLQPRCGA